MAKPIHHVRSRINGESVHPGIILQQQWMDPCELTQNELARMMGVSARRVNEIVHGRRAITADSAVRLSECLGMTPHYWMALQSDYEIERARRTVCRVPPPQEPASDRAIEGDEPCLPRRGWHRAATPQYRDAKRREAIISVLRREDLDDYDIPRETGNFP